MSIVDDNIPENDEMFKASLTLDPADQARLGNRVRVLPDVATIMVQDDDGKHFNVLSSNTYILQTSVTVQDVIETCSTCA